MFGGKVTVGNNLIDFGEVCNADHRISSEFRVLGNYDYTQLTLQYGTN
jgi:hypothetical protein